MNNQVHSRGYGKSVKEDYDVLNSDTFNICRSDFLYSGKVAIKRLYKAARISHNTWPELKNSCRDTLQQCTTMYRDKRQQLFGIRVRYVQCTVRCNYSLQRMRLQKKSVENVG